MTFLQICALVILILGCLLLFLIKPSKCGEEKKRKFFGRCYAHRGLHTADGSVPENSLAAFAAAAERGYGIELDVRLSRDGEVVVFHDETAERLCGVPERVCDMDAAELAALRLGGTEERIPALGEVLELVGGRVPLLIELKRGGRGRELCEKVCALIKSGGCDCAVQSFDPRLVGWFNRHACSVVRGQLLRHPSNYGAGASRPAAFLLGNAAANFISRPNFLSHELGKRSAGARLSRWIGAEPVCWTARSAAEAEEGRRGNSAVIFEFCEPAPVDSSGAPERSL